MKVSSTSETSIFPSASADQIERIERLLTHGVSDGIAPGVVVGVTNGRGTLFEMAVGYRSVADQIPMTTDTVFWVASMTKAITSVAALLTRADVTEGNRITALKSAMAAITYDVDFMPDIPKRHSLGFMVNELPSSTGRSAGSIAWAGLANCYTGLI